MIDTGSSPVPVPGPCADPGVDQLSAEQLPVGSIFYVGNATMLIRYDGFTILTDPAFIGRGEQTWLGYGQMTTRLTDPAIGIGDLPALDCILLSHYRGDHFDGAAERELDKGIPVLATPDSAADVAERGFTRCQGLEYWQSITFDSGHCRLAVTSLPAWHDAPLDGAAPPDVMGSLLEFRQSSTSEPYRIYISGDTMMIDELHEIRVRYPRIDLAILHLGGTRIGDTMVTMDAGEGMRAMRAIDARITMPIHYNDYDVFTSPLADFAASVDAAGRSDRVHYIRHGETFRFVVDGSPRAAMSR